MDEAIVVFSRKGMILVVSDLLRNHAATNHEA